MGFAIKAPGWYPTFIQMSTTALTLNEWNFVAVTNDSAGSLVFYLNGSVVSTFAGASYVETATHHIVVGSQGVAGGTFHRYEGQMNDVLIYSTQLSTADLDTLYTTTHP